MGGRRIDSEYRDPVDLIWIRAAERLGIGIQRSREVFASWDGQSTLSIAEQADFDPDDCLAQMIFHELCHSLVAGDRRHHLDWGLTNTDREDLVYEHATHRLQAALAGPYGLREFMAVTTEWRAYWDALPENPLADDGDPAVPIAQQAHHRSELPPYHDVLHGALRATAAIADVARQWAPDDSLWARTRARHVTGLLLNPASELQCGDCAWSHSSHGALRCRQSKTPAGIGKKVVAEERACVRWETKLAAEDCAVCGACCREGFDLVQVRPKESFAHKHPQLVEKTSLGLVVPRPKGQCVALQGDGGKQTPYRCQHYSDRPRACAEFPIAGDACLLARRRVGLSR
jgi:hypothetical protein